MARGGGFAGVTPSPPIAVGGTFFSGLECGAFTPLCCCGSSHRGNAVKTHGTDQGVLLRHRLSLEKKRRESAALQNGVPEGGEFSARVAHPRFSPPSIVTRSG